MADRFSETAPSLVGPATHAFTITPSDSASLSEVTRALYCGVGGDISVMLLSGATITLVNVPPGTILPVRVTKIAASGTTANGLIGLV